MVNLTFLAALLLALRLISVAFLLRVLWWQLQKLRRSYDDGLDDYRTLLFSITFIMFLGNIVPIMIDTAALFGSYVRNQPPLIGVLHALSNAGTSVASSAGWWFLYQTIDTKYDRQRREAEK